MWMIPCLPCWTNDVRGYRQEMVCLCSNAWSCCRQIPWNAEAIDHHCGSSGHRRNRFARHLRPLEPAPSPLEARTFDLRNLRLRKEKRFFTHFKGKTPFVVTLATSLLPQVPVFQIVLQGGNGCKGKKLYVCARMRDKFQRMQLPYTELTSIVVSLQTSRGKSRHPKAFFDIMWIWLSSPRSLARASPALSFQ